MTTISSTILNGEVNHAKAQILMQCPFISPFQPFHAKDIGVHWKIVMNSQVTRKAMMTAITIYVANLNDFVVNIRK